MRLFAIRKFMGPQENRLPAGSREVFTYEFSAAPF
jgi:hypothetical protein